MPKNNVIKNVILLAIVMLAFAAILETGLRISYPLYKNYNTEMWRYSVLLKKASSNPNVSHEHVPGKEASLYGVDVKINSDGYRDREYSVQKPANTYRIMVLGDSFTLGWGVPIEDAYSEVLEKMLNEKIKNRKFEVINTALGNYNTQMEYEMLREKGMKFEPDMIIVGYYPNDSELTVKFNPGSISTFIKRHSYTYAFFWDRITNIKTKLKVGQKTGSYTGYVHELYKGSFEGKKIMENSLNGIIDLGKQKNTTVVVIVLPQFFGDLKNYEFREVYPSVKNITSKKGVMAIDLLPYFQNNKVEEVIISYEDAHPNRLGHSIIAKAIYEKITPLIQANV